MQQNSRGGVFISVKGVQEEGSRGGRGETIFWGQEWEKISKNILKYIVNVYTYMCVWRHTFIVIG